MATFVFVHGSFHGSWCWEQLTAIVESSGHTAIAVDLPGRPGASTEHATLKSYAESVGRALEGQEHPIVLVGHSMAGVVITQAAEWFADLIDGLVYVCAFLPANGQSLLDLAQTDTRSVLNEALIFDEDAGLHWVPGDAANDAFYHDCTPELAAAAVARLVREPLAPVATPVVTTDERWGSTPRAYVRALQDRAISLDLQDRMLAATPCNPVFDLDCGHSPFLALPADLGRALLGFASGLPS